MRQRAFGAAEIAGSSLPSGISQSTLMKRKPKQTPKQTAKLLAQVIQGVAPIYAQHGKRIAGVVLPKP